MNTGRVTREDAGRPRAWQRMLSGRRLDLLHPSPADIEVDDIAHGLARVARWNGQTEGTSILSVAQHSVLVERIAGLIEPGLTAAERLAALLHDGPEYVVGDLISPFKAVLGDRYRAVERRILDAIHVRFGLPVSPPALIELIKQSDRMAAYCEATRLAGFTTDEAARIFGTPLPALAQVVFELTPLPSQAAEHHFLERFEQLTAARAADSPGRAAATE